MADAAPPVAAGQRTWPWLVAALGFAGWIAAKALVTAFSAPLVVQDDARQFIFWMARWGDPALFRGDLIADYFQAVSPAGFSLLYWVLAQLGVEPLLASKLIPVPLLLLLALASYRLAMALFPVSAAAFLASYLTVFFIALTDLTTSATPRAFAVPLFVLFLWLLVRRHGLAVVLVIGLMASFYPQISLVAMGVLALSPLRWEGGLRLHLSYDRRTWVTVGLGLAVGLGLLALFEATASGYGPVITLDQARQSPDFYGGGRVDMFKPNGQVPILCAGRTGFLPREWGCMAALPVMPLAQIALVIALPLALAWRAQYARRSRLNPQVQVLVHVLLVAITLYVLAYLLMFELHLPGRYSKMPLRGTTPIALAFGIAVLGRRLAAHRWPGLWSPRTGRVLAILLAGVSVIGPFGVTLVPGLAPRTLYEHSPYPALYARLRALPKDSLVAGFSRPIDFVPMFAQRPVLVAPEYAIPYSLGYAQRIHARAEAQIRGLYSPDPQALAAFLRQYGVTHVLVDDSDADTVRLNAGWWAHTFPDAATAARAALAAAGRPPALILRAEACTTLRERNVRLLEASCLAVED